MTLVVFPAKFQLPAAHAPHRSNI